VKLEFQKIMKEVNILIKKSHALEGPQESLVAYEEAAKRTTLDGE
jgi:hypothetical protein